MRNSEILRGFTLMLFDGEGAGNGAAASIGKESGEGGSADDPKNSAVGKQKVVYGKQPPDTTTKVDTTVTEGDVSAEADAPTMEEFEELIRGKYKDFFTEKTQGIINERFKKTKGLEKTVSEMTPIMDSLYAKYGVTPGDHQALSEAIDRDNAFLEQQAEAEGLTVEQYKQMKQMEFENRRFKEMQEQGRRDAALKQIYSGWVAEAEALGIDLASECQNKNFVELLSRGIGMEMAHKMVHYDESLNAAAQKAEKRVADTIRSGQARPAENGASTAQSGIVIKNDVSRLSREDRREIARKVARGEKISF